MRQREEKKRGKVPKKQRGDIIVYGLLALAILAVLSGIAYAIYNSIYSAGKASMKAEWDAAIAKQAKAETVQIDTATKSLEVKNVEAKIVYKTITRSVDKYIDRPIYRAECFDADGLRDANAALSGKAASPAKPDYSLPRPDPARRRNGEIGVTKAD